MTYLQQDAAVAADVAAETAAAGSSFYFLFAAAVATILETDVAVAANS